jgi:two-component system phosphate regulon sensor histidine kinase PhoR
MPALVKEAPTAATAPTAPTAATAATAPTALILKSPPHERRAADRYLAAQLSITRVLADAAGLSEALPKILKTACEKMDWDAAAIWEADYAARTLVCLDFWSGSQTPLAGFETASRKQPLAMGAGLPGLAWASGEPAWIPDVTAHRDGARNTAAGKAGLRCHFALPIRPGRKVFGVMEFFSRKARPIDYPLLQMLAVTGSQIGQFITHKRVEEALHESREKYRLLFSGVSDAIVIYDAETERIGDANEAALQLYGYGRTEFLDKSLRDISTEKTPRSVPREVPESHLQLISICRQKKRDGTLFPAEVTAGTFKWKDRLMGIRVERDITQRQRDEEAEKLRHSERMQREFVATVSHEFRTPVAAIQGFAQTLQKGGLDDARNRLGFVKIIEKHAKRLSRLVENLLELSAMESGKVSPKPETVSLAKYVRKYARTIAPLFKRKRLSLRVDIPPEVKASVDKSQLSQVFQNLFSNAIKFSRKGGRIHVTGRSLEHAVLVSVRDSGQGIPEEYLPKIFDRFNQARKDRSVGTGLGLSIAKQIVESHGGHIWAESSKGRGAVFHFTLPRAE